MTSALLLAFTVALAPQGLDPEGDTVHTTLTAVRQDPEAFREVKVSFPVQFASLGRIQNPFFTRFVPSEYANFYAWADEQPIWRKGEYDDVFSNLFLSKESTQLQQLCDLRVYDRLQVTGIVRNTFQESPWIEVTSFTPLGGKVTTATLAHMYRGEQYAQRRQWQRAISELEHVNTAGAPPVLEYAVNKRLGVCYLRIGEAGPARSHLESAAGYPDADYETTSLLATARSAPELEVDRTVDDSEVKDHQRPLWEAFEGGLASTGTRN